MEEEKGESNCFFDEIDQWMKNDGVVTFKYLSQKKKIHVNSAKVILQDYKQFKKSQGVNLQTEYLLICHVETGHTKVILVTEERKGKVLEKFDVLSEHIYSIAISKEKLYSVDTEKLPSKKEENKSDSLRLDKTTETLLKDL